MESIWKKDLTVEQKVFGKSETIESIWMESICKKYLTVEKKVFERDKVWLHFVALQARQKDLCSNGKLKHCVASLSYTVSYNNAEQWEKQVCINADKNRSIASLQQESHIDNLKSYKVNCNNA